MFLKIVNFFFFFRCLFSVVLASFFFVNECLCVRARIFYVFLYGIIFFFFFVSRLVKMYYYLLQKTHTPHPCPPVLFNPHDPHWKKLLLNITSISNTYLYILTNIVQIHIRILFTSGSSMTIFPVHPRSLSNPNR